MRSLTAAVTAVTFLSLTAASQALPIFDQIGTNGAGIKNTAEYSQDFEPQMEAYDVMAVEDLKVTTATKLTDLSFGMRFLNSASNDLSQITNYHFAIFNAASGLPVSTLIGNVADLNITPSKAAITSNYGVVGNYLVSLNLAPHNITLAPGSYVFGVQPANSFAANGQVGIASSTISNGLTSNAYLLNPNGGFHYGNGYSKLSNTNLAYRLSGTQAVPEPATMAALGLGVVALVKRRKRA